MTTPLSPAVVRQLQERLVTPALPARYQPLEIIGRGGMGVVWRATDALLDRDVAIKVLAEHVDSPEWTARLMREARILASLEHPAIVAVHDAGVLEDGRPWYAMRLVRGEALDVAGKGFATPGEAVRALMKVTEAVAFAHANGVIHRDLKPGNVMVGPFGEVLVLDWGVARLRGESVAPARASGDRLRTEPETVDGAVIGTPGYMAPEQATGQAADERSDVHGLGAILRDLLATQQSPVTRPLLAVRDRALAIDPATRYPTAAAFREELERYLDGLPVSAYRETALERLQRVVYQYRAPILLVFAYLLMRLAVLWWSGI